MQRRRASTKKETVENPLNYVMSCRRWSVHRRHGAIDVGKQSCLQLHQSSSLSKKRYGWSDERSFQRNIIDSSFVSIFTHIFGVIAFEWENSYVWMCRRKSFASLNIILTCIQFSCFFCWHTDAGYTFHVVVWADLVKRKTLRLRWALSSLCI